jgi:hypothetical protein
MNHVFVFSGGSVCGLLNNPMDYFLRLCNTHSIWINHTVMKCLNWFCEDFFFPLECWSTLLFLHLLMLNLFPVVEIERLVLLFFYFDLSLQDMLAGFYSDLIAKCSVKRPLSEFLLYQEYYVQCWIYFLYWHWINTKLIYFNFTF